DDTPSLDTTPANQPTVPTTTLDANQERLTQLPPPASRIYKFVPYIYKPPRDHHNAHATYRLDVEVDDDAALHHAANLTVDPSDISPSSRREAMASQYAQEWLDAEATELKALQDAGTFTIVDPPPGTNTVGSNSPGRARLTQKHGVD
ncbi:hypothetical protein HDU67_000870, partial [Dinochytrium kinnereticum]